MKQIISFVVSIAALVCATPHPSLAADRQHKVLFIAIDDQNDWIGHLGGHPLVKTPNLDRLARRGTTFLNAHVQSPLCNPSRSSLMLGLRPTTTGIYGLEPWFRNVEAWKDRVTLSYCQELCSEVLNQAAFCRTPSVKILPSRTRAIW
jgi:hypothetical protein